MYEVNKLFNIEFEIKKIIYRSEEDNLSTICKVKLLNHDYEGKGVNTIPEMCILQGEFQSLYVGDTFEAKVSWTKNFVYGYQLIVKENLKIKIPDLAKGLALFIQKRVKGLGINRANRIVDELGLDCISLILNDWTKLLSVEGIKEKMAKRIYDTLTTEKKFENVSIFINSMGLRQDVAIKLYEEFKDETIIKINENPYIMCGLRGLTFQQADIIAFKLGFDSLFFERIKNGIFHYLNFNMKNKGNIYILKDTLIEEIEHFLASIGSFDEVGIPDDLINKCLEELVKGFKIVIEKNGEGKECIYRKDYNVIENTIVELLDKIMTESKEPFCLDFQIKEFLDDYESKFFKLAKKQKEAVYMGLKNGLSIITGGPGTGKTQTINTIIKCIEHINPNATIKLSAPTGKASKRMTELTNKEATTIHRLINLNSFNEYAELEEIYADFIIVDEASMIDAYVFCSLLKCISSNTRIIFVGDYQQLPSVAPGLILRDLITSNKIPVTILDEIFRQAQDSQIVMNAYKIINGENDLSFDLEKKDFYFIERHDPLSIKETIMKSINNLQENRGFKLNDIAVLSPTRKELIGTKELNRAIQRKYNAPTNKPDLEIDNSNLFRVSDTVMQVTNNYDKEVFNGEVGTITSIYAGRNGIEITVDYGDRDVVYEEKEFKEEVILSYSTTIHKSQGSEFPIVIIPVHESQKSMLNRNLLYTAVTRAKQVVVMIGSKSALAYGIDKQDNIERLSGIKEKIIKTL